MSNPVAFKPCWRSADTVAAVLTRVCGDPLKLVEIDCVSCWFGTQWETTVHFSLQVCENWLLKGICAIVLFQFIFSFFIISLFCAITWYIYVSLLLESRLSQMELNFFYMLTIWIIKCRGENICLNLKGTFKVSFPKACADSPDMNTVL